MYIDKGYLRKNERKNYGIFFIKKNEFIK